MSKMRYGISHCIECSSEFKWRRSTTQKDAQFCSKKCWYKNNAKKLASFNDKRFQWEHSTSQDKIDRIISRFNEKVVKKDGCWDWIGTKDKNGYPLLFSGSSGYKFSEQRGNRISWLIHKGEVPKGMNVLHKCDNPVCCNPEHLFLGTPKANSEDRDRKGRSAYGEKSKTSKLTNDDVKKIKYLLSIGVTQKRIGKDFKVNYRTIGNIHRGITWKHID